MEEGDENAPVPRGTEDVYSHVLYALCEMRVGRVELRDALVKRMMKCVGKEEAGEWTVARRIG